MTKYQITFCEADTGNILLEDGQRFRSDVHERMFQPQFDNIEDAHSCKDELLQKFPFGEVWIKGGEKDLMFRNDEQLDLYLEERKKVYHWMTLPFFFKWFKKKPNCKIYKDR